MSDFLLCSCGCGGALHPTTARITHPAQRVTGPTSAPIALADAKLHLRVEHEVDDALIGRLIEAAREYAEGETGLALGADQTYLLTVDGTPSAWPIPLTPGPVTALGEVTLVDSARASLVVVDALLDLATSPALLYPPPAGWPPAPSSAPWVRTQVGFTAGSDTVPAPIIHAMYLLLGEWYDSRAAVRLGSSIAPIPFGVEALLAQYRTTAGITASR